jgi:hypothetical protein
MQIIITEDTLKIPIDGKPGEYEVYHRIGEVLDGKNDPDALKKLKAQMLSQRKTPRPKPEVIN